MGCAMKNCSKHVKRNKNFQEKEEVAREEFGNHSINFLYTNLKNEIKINYTLNSFY